MKEKLRNLKFRLFLIWTIYLTIQLKLGVKKMAFMMRTSKPENGNKFYNTTGKGGYSMCVVGSPTDSGCNVLSNCVGYACGRFNEIIGSMKYPYLNCNAENFIERAKQFGLTVIDKPSLGGIMVWQKGSSLDDYDGAGHVEVVERIDSSTSVLTSASNYGGTAFYTSIRNKNSGSWGLGSPYKFRGCIVNPAIGQKTEPSTPTPAPTPSSFFPTKGYFSKGDVSANVGKIADFMYRVFPAYTSKNALGNTYGPYIMSAITEFQKRTGLEADGCTGPITLAKLKSFGFSE